MSNVEANHREQEADGSSESDVVGERINSKFGRRLVTGNGEYLDDIERPGMYHAYFVRSEHAHAEISVDTTGAEQMSGVSRVWTHEDIADKVNEPYGYMFYDEVTLADERVIFQGQPIAVVLAQTRERAREAAKRVEVKYENLPVVTDVSEAVSDEAPLIHPELDSDPDSPVEGNIAESGQVIAGDVDKAFESADVVVEDTFEYNRITPAPMEPHGCVAEYNAGDQALTLHSSSQFPHRLKQEIDDVLEAVDAEDITVKAPDIGGGFGIKLELFPFEICAALLAIETNRPVKYALDRLEEMQTGRGRGGKEMEGRLALDADGTITGIEVDLKLETGAFASHDPAVGYSSSVCGHGPYPIENMHWNYELIYTNLMPGSAVRGFGDPVITFMREQLVDMAAEELGRDPIDLRLQNVPEPEVLPMRSPAGLKWRNADMPTCVEKVKEEIDWETHREADKVDGSYRGVGIGTIMKRGGNKSAAGGDYDEAIVRMGRRSDVTVFSPISSIGQGTETALAQIAAEELGVSIDQVQPVVGDSDLTPEGLGVWADRGTIIGGSAVARAAEDLGDRLRALAAHVLDGELGKADIVLKDGQAYESGSPSNSLEIAELTDIAMRGDPEEIGYDSERPPELRNGISLVGRGKYESQEAEFLDEETGYGNVSHSYTFGALALVVDVDPTTGEIDIVDVAICEDLGKVMNPKLVEGQAQGGIVEGLGEVLLEEYQYDEDGKLQNGTLMDYHPPAAPDVPMITKIDHIENPDPTTSHGQKGAGECPLVPTPAAVANAVADATGIRFTKPPFTAEKVLLGLIEEDLREL